MKTKRIPLSIAMGVTLEEEDENTLKVSMDGGNKHLMDDYICPIIQAQLYLNDMCSRHTKNEHGHTIRHEVFESAAEPDFEHLCAVISEPFGRVKESADQGTEVVDALKHKYDELMDECSTNPDNYRTKFKSGRFYEPGEEYAGEHAGEYESTAWDPANTQDPYGYEVYEAPVPDSRMTVIPGEYETLRAELLARLSRAAIGKEIAMLTERLPNGQAQPIAVASFDEEGVVPLESPPADNRISVLHEVRELGDHFKQAMAESAMDTLRDNWNQLPTDANLLVDDIRTALRPLTYMPKEADPVISLDALEYLANSLAIPFEKRSGQPVPAQEKMPPPLP